MIHSIPELQPQDPNHTGRPEEDSADVILDGHNGIVMDVAVSDEVNGQYYLASVGNDYSLYVYTISKRTSHAWNKERAHNSYGYNSLFICSVIDTVTFGHSSSAGLLFTGGWDSLIRVWNCENGELVKELDYHDERITDLTVTKDGRYVSMIDQFDLQLVSASADKTILLFDIVNDFIPVQRYSTDDECKCVVTTEQTIVAGYESGVIRIWSLPSKNSNESFVRTHV